MMTKRFAILSIMTALLLPGAAGASAGVTLVNSGDWFDAANWEPHVPTAEDKVTIGGGHAVTVARPGAVAGTIRVGDDAGDGTVTVAGGGELAITGPAWIGAGTGGVGILNVEGGALTYEGNVDLYIGLDAGTEGVVNMRAGELRVARDVVVGGDGTGVLNLEGGAYYSGRDLRIADGGGAGAVNISGGLSLHNHRHIVVGPKEGAGTLQLIGSDHSINFFRGDLTFGENGTLIVACDEGGVTSLEMRGDIALNGTLKVRRAYDFDGELPVIVDVLELLGALRTIDGAFARVVFEDGLVGEADYSSPRAMRLLGTAATVVHVRNSPLQQMTYGMDFERLWHFNEEGYEIDYDELAEWSVGKCPVDYVRIAINPAAELEEGKIDWSVYDRQIKIMRALERVRPDIQWFASPRPIHNEVRNAPFTCFPLWISVWDNPFMEDPERPRTFSHLEAEKGGDYYVRYLRYMQEQGFEMTYLDAINEATRHLEPGDVALLVDRVREQMGDEMPIVIAPSAHNWGEAVRWIEQAIEMGRDDFWEISASHNTREWGDIHAFAELARSLGHDIWNTELHGFRGPHPASNPDGCLVSSTSVLFQHVRAGYGGLNNWLSLGNERKVHKMLRNVRGDLVVMPKYHIWKHLVTQTQGAHYLETHQTAGLGGAMMFHREEDDLTTLWLLNDSHMPLEDVRVEFSGFDGGLRPVEVTWFTRDEDLEQMSTTGESKALDAEATETFIRDLDPHTLYIFTLAR